MGCLTIIILTLTIIIHCLNIKNGGIKSVKFESQLFSIFALKLTLDEVHLKVIKFRVCAQHILGPRTFRPIGSLWMAGSGGIKL